MNNKYVNYLKQKTLLNAMAEFGKGDYDLDDYIVEDIYNGWTNACSDLLTEIFKRHPEIVEELKNEE